MSDKKSCENCEYVNAGFLCHDRSSNPHLTKRRVNVCSHWRRDPSMWLSILPTEPGWYWWRETSDHMSAMIHLFSDEIKESKQHVGEFQGPITPKESK